MLLRSKGGCYFFTIFPSTQSNIFYILRLSSILRFYILCGFDYFLHLVSNTVVEPYNTALVLDKLKHENDVVCIDNESLFKICFNTLGLQSPT